MKIHLSTLALAFLISSTAIAATQPKAPKGIHKSSIGVFYYKADNCKPILSWKPRYPDEVSYDVILYTAIDGNQPTPGFLVAHQEEIQTTTYQVPQMLSSNSNYLWSVRSHLKDGRTSSWASHSESNILLQTNTTNLMYGLKTPNCGPDSPATTFDADAFNKQILNTKKMTGETLAAYLNQGHSVVVFHVQSLIVNYSKLRKRLKSGEQFADMQEMLSKYAKPNKHPSLILNIFREGMPSPKKLPVIDNKVIFGAPSAQYYLSSFYNGGPSFSRETPIMHPLELSSGKLIYGGDVVDVNMGQEYYLTSNFDAFKSWVKSQYPQIPDEQIAKQDLFYNEKQSPEIQIPLPENTWVPFK